MKTVAVNLPSRHTENTAQTADDAQQPDSPKEEAPPETPKPAPVEKLPAVTRPKPVEDTPRVTRSRRHKSTPRVRQADVAESGDTGDAGDSEATTVRVSAPRRSRHRSVDITSNDNGDLGDNERPKAKAKFHDTETVGSGLFRVHLGAFHSRDAAAQEVARARSKGFDAQIVQVTRNGRTLYRVQAGAFRERSRAEFGAAEFAGRQTWTRAFPIRSADKDSRRTACASNYERSRQKNRKTLARNRASVYNSA